MSYMAPERTLSNLNSTLIGLGRCTLAAGDWHLRCLNLSSKNFQHHLLTKSLELFVKDKHQGAPVFVFSKTFAPLCVMTPFKPFLGDNTMFLTLLLVVISSSEMEVYLRLRTKWMIVDPSKLMPGDP
jgi:hypothetical protein